MRWLQGQGRVGLAVQWGNWGGGGMAVRNKGFIERMERMGLGIGERARLLAAALSLPGRHCSTCACWTINQRKPPLDADAALQLIRLLPRSRPGRGPGRHVAPAARRRRHLQRLELATGAVCGQRLPLGQHRAGHARCASLPPGVCPGKVGAVVDKVYGRLP